MDHRSLAFVSPRGEGLRVSAPAKQSLQRSELPDVWTHREPKRTWQGSVDGASSRPGVRGNWLFVLGVLTRHEFQARYRAQALGVVWSLLHPLVMMALLSLVFTRLYPAGMPNFPIFTLIGVILWQFVSSAASAGAVSFVSNADLVKRTVFRRELLPISFVLSYGINFLMESSLLLIFIPIFPSAFRLTPALLLVPLMLAALLTLLSGVALAVSVLNVIYRDVAYLVQTSLTLLYWLTPIIYPLDRISEPYRAILKCNPIGAILVAVRGAIMTGTCPTALGWASIWVPSLGIFALGWAIFRHYERMVLDYV
jgi:ABC-2 type transport system permease protein